MTKKPTHIAPAEPKELGPEPADTTGKELEPVRDWDWPQLIAAIQYGQHDIIEAELAWLEASPTWRQTAKKPFAHIYTAPADLIDKTLSLCRLDNIPTTYDQPTQLWPVVR